MLLPVLQLIGICIIVVSYQSYRYQSYHITIKILKTQKPTFAS